MIVPSAFLRRFAAMAWATAIVSFLYGSGLSGKEGQALAAEAASCRALSASLEEINRLAKGDIAALTISKTPLALPDLSFNGPEGAPVSLSSFHGKIVLLNIWATWCVPCRGEMPELDKLQADFGSEKFHVAAVNIDTTRLEHCQSLNLAFAGSDQVIEQQNFLALMKLAFDLQTGTMLLGLHPRKDHRNTGGQTGSSRQR